MDHFKSVENCQIATNSKSQVIFSPYCISMMLNLSFGILEIFLPRIFFISFEFHLICVHESLISHCDAISPQI